MDAYLDAMRKGATFTGRSSRSEFWQFYAVYIAMFTVIPSPRSNGSGS